MWRRKTKPEPAPVREARREAERTEAVQRDVEAQWPAVDRVNNEIKDYLKRNHFGEKLTIAIRRKA